MHGCMPLIDRRAGCIAVIGCFPYGACLSAHDNDIDIIRVMIRGYQLIVRELLPGSRRYWHQRHTRDNSKTGFEHHQRVNI